MSSGVVYAAWLAGRWQLIAMDRPRRVARLSIGGRSVAARGGTYPTGMQWGGQTGRQLHGGNGGGAVVSDTEGSR